MLMAVSLSSILFWYLGESISGTQTVDEHWDQVDDHEFVELFHDVEEKEVWIKECEVKREQKVNWLPTRPGKSRNHETPV